MRVGASNVGRGEGAYPGAALSANAPPPLPRWRSDGDGFVPEYRPAPRPLQPIATNANQTAPGTQARRCLAAGQPVIWPRGRQRDGWAAMQPKTTNARSIMTRTRRRRRVPSPLARLSTTSLYETCATALNREIETGTLRPGQRLPSERSLGDALGFTRLTVRRALQVLAQRGLLEPDERRGWQVRSGQVSDSLSTLMGFTQMARMRGLVASSRILSLEYRDATFDESESLRVAPGAPILDLSRLRLLDDRPTAVERLRMPVKRMHWPEGFDFTGSIYAALESQGIAPTVADAYVDVV